VTWKYPSNYNPSQSSWIRFNNSAWLDDNLRHRQSRHLAVGLRRTLSADGNAHQCFRSYHLGQMHYISHGALWSLITRLLCSVSQGSVLVLLRFILYTTAVSATRDMSSRRCHGDVPMQSWFLFWRPLVGAFMVFLLRASPVSVFLVPLGDCKRFAILTIATNCRQAAVP